ncbi:MAG: tRNA preQ1(34) S-adenosylmethionine ribosyltransferase-isomerase QueA [Anaerolineae bacterium]|nr:tRNA preQ1(34) S-adenosylmethionine ribosyltransferase-isomerase QueA [Anaerolineae bacterium]MDW8070416.1 tRNA preQ1(34) S-adenosylmethionine ribosyltransferase-isomerase QueA [Anaerolineae bacterium]
MSGKIWKTSDFDYELPPERIAQTPIEPRDAARLMVVHRRSGHIEHRIFRDLPYYLHPGDVLVVNDTRVIPARLFAHKPSGGQVEILLLRQLDETRWEALVGGKRIRKGSYLLIHRGDAHLQARVVEELEGSRRILEFDTPIAPLLRDIGHTPLPPYIRLPLQDPERYQTVYGRVEGSAAAPTAGLHFTPELLAKLRAQGVLLARVTLHIGLDTFKPVTVEHVAEHTLHSEWASVSAETAQLINQARLNGGRVVAVGTTVVRTLETAALRAAGITAPLRDISAQSGELADAHLSVGWHPIAAFEGPTDLFIYPGFRFRAVDALITNFHLPRSSLLMLVSAFAGYERTRHAYQVAVAAGYRFYSFGDAMLII